MATLFSKVKGGPAEKKQLLALLTFIVDGTRGKYAQAIVPQVLALKIEKLEPGLITPTTGASVDPAGNITMAATEKGIKAVYPAAGAVAVELNKTAFVLEKGFVAPPTKRGGFGKEDTYPFAQMEAGDSFFVKATDERPNPAKALASTVSSATKRNATMYPEGHAKAGQPTGKDGRSFVVRNRTAEDKDPGGVGARVYRVA
jgi:hypothetical protein